MCSSDLHLIAQTIVDKLQVACIDDLPSSDTSRADKVVLRTTALTGKERIVLTVKHYDPLKAESAGDSTKAGMNEANFVFKGWPDQIIGGMTFETIRGIIELRCNFTQTKENPEEADRIAQLVLGRAKQALRGGVGIRLLVDEFGERCMDFKVIGGTEYDSGADTSNNSRYFLRWAAPTLPAVPSA